jgi:transcriptional regulator with GAF, ATPase, and Fis domain
MFPADCQEWDRASEALRRANGNQTIAAQLLGLSRRALNNRLRRTDK